MARADEPTAAASTRISIEQLMAQHYDGVVRLAYSLAGDRHAAEDIAQEVFLAALSGLERFRGDAKPSTWLYRITVRVAGRMLARQRRHRGDPSALDVLPSDEGAEDGAALAQLHIAIHCLPLPARLVLSLVVVQGLSHADAAEVLGVPVGTIGSRLHTARQHLVREL